MRTACKALTSRGCAKSGANSQWESFLTDISEINHLVTFVGSRFNIVFKNAASLFYHRVHLKDFLSLIPDPNLLLKSIKFDIDEPVYLAGIRALGIIDKVITGPFWRLLERKGTSNLDTNMYLHQMQIQLNLWAKDASSLLGGDPMFPENDIPIHKDKIYESLFGDYEANFDSMMQAALEMSMHGLLLILERQAN